MKPKYFISLGLVIILFFGPLPHFVFDEFLQLQIEDKNNIIKSSSINKSWILSLDFIPQAITIDSNNCIYIIEDDYSYDYLLKIVKYDSLGTLLWNKQFEGFHIYNPVIKTDSNNNLYLACSFRNETSELCTTLFKFNSSGEIRWLQIWESENITDIYDIAIDSDDNIFIYGSWESTNRTIQKIFIMKYNAMGDQLLYHNIEESSTNTKGVDLEIDSDSNIIVSGSSYINQSIYWVRSYNISLSLQWSVKSKFESFSQLALDSLDNVISLAWVWDYLTYERHLLLVKYNKSGSSVWNYTFESRFIKLLWQPIPVPMKYQFDLTLDSLDNIYVAWNIEIPNDLYATDILLIKINNSGSFDWYLTWGGSDYEQSLSLNSDSNDNIYLVSEHYLVKNPRNNGKSLYRTNVRNLLLILFGIFCLTSLVSLFFIIIKPKIRKPSPNLENLNYKKKRKSIKFGKLYILLYHHYNGVKIYYAKGC